jgi:uncharacterized protein YegL
METRIWEDINDSQEKFSNGCSGTSLAPVIRHTEGVERTKNILLIDVSGSTEDATSRNDRTPKLYREKEVATMCISKFPSEAEFALISFGEPAQVEIPLQNLNQKLNAIQKVQQLDYDGATGMRSALTLALKELEKGNANYFARVYCITDGMATDGDCTRIANQLKATGIQLHFIGFGSGSGIDEATMRKLASVSDNGQPMYMHFTEFSELSQYMGTQTQTITH